MESIDPVWLFGSIALAAGILLGVLLNRLLGSDAEDVDKLRAELAESQLEMENYKASVNSHFNKTSELVNELTQDYVKVYRHLAEGAQNLSDTREFTQVLEQPQGQVLFSVEKKNPEPDSVLTGEDSVMSEATKPSAPEITPIMDPDATREKAASVKNSVTPQPAAVAEETSIADTSVPPAGETTDTSDTTLTTPEPDSVKPGKAVETDADTAPTKKV